MLPLPLPLPSLGEKKREERTLGNFLELCHSQCSLWSSSSGFIWHWLEMLSSPSDLPNQSLRFIRIPRELICIGKSGKCGLHCLTSEDTLALSPRVTQLTWPQTQDPYLTRVHTAPVMTRSPVIVTMPLILGRPVFKCFLQRSL